MLRLFHYILSVNRKRRSLAVTIALRILRLVRDIEQDEAYRYSDKLDEFELDSLKVHRCDYTEIEEEYSNCEYTLGFLECAIDDLEFAY